MTKTSFQVDSSIQGDAFFQAAKTVLRTEGWEIIDTNSPADVGYPNVDIYAVAPTGHPYEGVLCWIEARGSWRGGVPGLRRDDTVKKILGVAADLKELREDWSHDGATPIPYIVLTSHLPKPGTVSEAMLNRAIKLGYITEVRVIVTQGP